MIEIDSPGRESDAGIYSTSKLGIAVESGKLNFPPAEQLEDL